MRDECTSSSLYNALKRPSLYEDDIWSLLPERPPEPDERREPGRVPPGEGGCEVPAGPNFPTFIPSSMPSAIFSHRMSGF